MISGLSESRKEIGKKYVNIRKIKYFLSRFAKLCRIDNINKEITAMKEVIRNKKLNIRVSSDEKKEILKKAKKMNMSISDYSRMILLSKDRKGITGNLMVSNILVKSQELANYIQDSYGKDKELERMIGELWEIN